MDVKRVVDGVATAVCVAVMAIPMVAVIAYGIRSRTAYAARIRELRREDAYSDWEKPPLARRLRLLVACATLALCSLPVWITLLFTDRGFALSTPVLVVVAVVILAGLAAGFTLQWLAVHPSRSK